MPSVCRHFARKQEVPIDVAVITDDDNLYYLTGRYDVLHLMFGRPIDPIVGRESACLLISPSLGLNAARSAARVDTIAAWSDGLDADWRSELPAAVSRATQVEIEPDQMSLPVRSYAVTPVLPEQIVSVSPLVA